MPVDTDAGELITTSPPVDAPAELPTPAASVTALSEVDVVVTLLFKVRLPEVVRMSMTPGVLMPFTEATVPIAKAFAFLNVNEPLPLSIAAKFDTLLALLSV